MKTLIVSSSDNIGGAALAALRLHKSLMAGGLESRMRVGIKKSDIVSVDGPQTRFCKILYSARRFLGQTLMRLQKTDNSFFHSPSILPSYLADEINTSPADVINLHWVCDEFLSIKDVGRIRKPAVWTLHDMWAFSGAEHYGPDNPSARWKNGYTADNRPPSHKGFDIDRWVWNRKRRAWRYPMQIVTPSRWLSECVKASYLMRNWSVTVIPNVLDCRQFQPWPKFLAREILGLPPKPVLILFGAMGGGKNFIKGWDLLQPALARIASEHIGVHGVIFGQSEPSHPPNLGLPLHWMGHLNDDASLALLYSAADVMVVPSRQEAFGQTGSEAQACGCPVVAFNCTGLQDIVEHRVTGYLAMPYDSVDLANGIRWVIENKYRYESLSRAARERALRLWAPEVVIPRYKEIYEAVRSSEMVKS
jgi:glycosyltransferase involved in cell wall biosynthesis